MEDCRIMDTQPILIIVKISIMSFSLGHWCNTNASTQYVNFHLQLGLLLRHLIRIQNLRVAWYTRRYQLWRYRECSVGARSDRLNFRMNGYRGEHVACGMWDGHIYYQQHQLPVGANPTSHPTFRRTLRCFTHSPFLSAIRCLCRFSLR